MSRLDTLQVLPDAFGAALTPSRKRFHTLLRKIAQSRDTLAAWHDHVVSCRQVHGKLLKPLQAELLAGLEGWARALDALLDQRHWNKTDRGTLRECLCEAVGVLLENRADDAQLKALFDKHAEIDFDTAQRDKIAALKDLAEAMTGLDLGDDDGIGTDADLFARLQQGLHEQAAAAEARRDAKSAGSRPSAAQQRREAEAAQATQSVREVYRKLASALHPDRETDEQQRQAKTVLMQRVNQAYEANDLLTLLELQLQIEQIDPSHIANAGEQRLKHYNKVLAGQLAELKAELEHVEMAFRIEFGMQPGGRLDPRKLGQVLEQTRRQWQAELDEQRRDLHMLSDVAATRRWLKRQREQWREDDLDTDFAFF